MILEWASDGHNGGDLGFGPDGYPLRHVGRRHQRFRRQPSRPRFDAPDRQGVAHRRGPSGRPARPYSVPKDNPFVDRKGVRPETWAYGMRNPWRMTFDRKTGRLWVGQNGQDLWEQAYVIHKGDNCGWSVNEGSHPFQPERARGPDPIVMPAVEHHHSVFRSLTGGVVYYGKKYPDLDGAYIYGDYSTGAIWAARNDGTKTLSDMPLADSRLQIVGFGVDPDGELLIVDHAGGLYTLEPTPKEQPHAAFSHEAERNRTIHLRQGASGRSRSDSLRRERPALVRRRHQGTLHRSARRRQNRVRRLSTAGIFRKVTVLVKTFSLEPGHAAALPHGAASKLGCLTKQEGQWQGYSYLWNDAQTDAELVPAAGLDRVYEVRDSDKSGTRAQADLALSQPRGVPGLPQPGGQLGSGPHQNADEQSP